MPVALVNRTVVTAATYRDHIEAVLRSEYDVSQCLTLNERLRQIVHTANHIRDLERITFKRQDPTLAERAENAIKRAREAIKRVEAEQAAATGPESIPVKGRFLLSEIVANLARAGVIFAVTPVRKSDDEWCVTVHKGDGGALRSARQKAEKELVDRVDLTTPNTWKDWSPDGLGRRMLATIHVHGCPLHLEAFEVKRDEYKAVAIDPDNQAKIDWLEEQASSAIALMEYANTLWCVIATPHAL